MKCYYVQVLMRTDSAGVDEVLLCAWVGDCHNFTEFA